MKKIITGIFLVIAAFSAQISLAQNAPHAVDKRLWKSDASPLRAVVECGEIDGALQVLLEWRLPYPVEKDTRVSVFRLQDGRPVKNIFVRELSSEKAFLAFEPLGKGQYEIYIHTNTTVAQGNLPADENWILRNGVRDYLTFIRLPKAKFMAYQYHYEKDVLHPYRLMANQTEIDAYNADHYNTITVAPVPGEYPVVVENGQIPLMLLDKAKAEELYNKTTPTFLGNLKNIFDLKKIFSKEVQSVGPAVIDAEKGDVCLFQVLMYGGEKSFEGIDISFSDFKGEAGGRIPAHDFRVIRSQGGICIEQAAVSNVWIALPVSLLQTKGQYTGSVAVKAADGTQMVVPFNLSVNDTKAKEQLDINLLSRFGKFQTDIEPASDDAPDRFQALKTLNNSVFTPDKIIKINPRNALPSQINIKGKDILSSPMMLVLTSSYGTRKFGVNKMEFLRSEGDTVQWQAQVKTADLRVRLFAGMCSSERMSLRAEMESLIPQMFTHISFQFALAEPYAAVCTLSPQGSCRITADTLLPPSLQCHKFWIGSPDAGILIDVPLQKDNLLAGADASLDIYPRGKTSVVLSVKNILVPAADTVNLAFDMQLLPGDFSTVNDLAGKTLALCEGIPTQEQLRGVANLVLVNPWETLGCEENKQALKDISKRGIHISLLYRESTLPSDSRLVNALRSMGFACRPVANGEFVEFEPSDELDDFFHNGIARLLSEGVIDGVTLTGLYFERQRVEKLYNFGRLYNKNFSLNILRTPASGVSYLEAAPWTDRVFLVQDKENLFNSPLGELKEVYPEP